MEPINLDSYRLGPNSQEARTPLGWAKLALERAFAIAAFVPFLTPKNVYANPRGGMNLHFRPFTDLEAAGASPTDDSFLLEIQFTNVRSAVMGGTQDPVENYGPLFSLASFFWMLQTGDPAQFYAFVTAMHTYDKGTAGQGGEGTVAPLPAGTQELMQLLAAPAIAEQIARLMNDGLPALPKQQSGGFPAPVVGGIKKNKEDDE